MTSRLKKDGEEDKNRHLLENFLENFSIWQTHISDALITLSLSKMGCIFVMVISYGLPMGQYRDDSHREGSPLFIF